MKRLFLGLLFTLALVILAWAGGLTLFPSAPVLTISDNASGLSWDANLEADLAGYLLAYAVNDANYMEEALIDLGNVLTYDFEALPADVVRDGNKIDFVLHAYDTSALRSAASNEVSISFLLNTPPGAPAGLSKTY